MIHSIYLVMTIRVPRFKGERRGRERGRQSNVNVCIESDVNKIAELRYLKELGKEAGGARRRVATTKCTPPSVSFNNSKTLRVYLLSINK